MTDSKPTRSALGRKTASLGGGDIGLCLTRVHHDRFTPSVPIDDPIRERLFERGNEYEATVVADLLETTGSVECSTADDVPISVDTAVVVANGIGRAAASSVTLAAMDAGAPLIVRGWLNNADKSLVGAPDLLVRGDGGYMPVDIKNHFVVGERGLDAVTAPLHELTDPGSAALFRTGRKRDLLQVAHYWELLLGTGHQASRAVGGIIGSDDPTQCLWVDLDTNGASILEEHAVFVAAARDTIEWGSTHPEEPSHGPWWRSECNRCDWRGLCRSELLAVDDPTLLSRVNKDDKISLAIDGVATIADIADLELGDERFSERGIVQQARARAVNRLLRSDDGSGPLDVPSAAREVDFDIETHGGRIYLAGFLITEDGISRYDPVAEWSGTLEGEGRLTEKLFDRLVSYTDAGTIVYHWTAYERRILAEAGERHGVEIEGFNSVTDWFNAHAVDLYEWTRHNLVSPSGYSLKVIAPLCGFEWRDDDPGGLQSEIWFEQLLAGDEPMRQRLLDYNEDDVIAQREVRRWVRDADSGTGPGSAIDSVLEWPLPRPVDSAH